MVDLYEKPLPGRRGEFAAAALGAAAAA